MARKKQAGPEAVWTVLAALWLAVFPLWFGPYQALTQAKLTGMWVLAAVSILVAVGTFLVMEKRYSFCWNTAQKAAGLYFLWVLLSAVLGSRADVLNEQGKLAVWFGTVRCEGTLTQLCYGLIFLVMSLVPVKEKAWLHAVAGSLLVYCGIVALQYAGANPLGMFPEGLGFPEYFEFQGTLGNTNMVSAYLSMAVPLVLMGYVRWGQGFHLAAGLCGVFLMTCLEVQSGILALAVLGALLLARILTDPDSRKRSIAGLTGPLCAVLLRKAVCIPWYDPGPVLTILPENLWMTALAAVTGGLAYRFCGAWKGQWKGRSVLLAGGALVLAILAAVALMPIPETAGGLWELHEVLCGRPQDHFGTWRLGLWRFTLDMSLESPLFGTGPDTYYFAMGDYLEKAGVVLAEYYDNPHNLILAILSGSGWPAAALFAALLIFTLRNAWSRRENQAMLPCAAAICCYMVQGMFTFSVCLVSPMFFAVLGMAACPGPGAAEPAKPKKPRK